MPKRKVVLTGATGYIAIRMLPALQERYDLTLLDVKSTDPDGNEISGVIKTDLINRDRDAYREYFAGVDAVIHCGFKGTVNSSHIDFWKELDNVTMCYNVYQTCIEENVRRLVMMSSNHAADYYERLIWADKMNLVTPDMNPLTDNFYGWGKISYEALGFVFATGQMTDGKKLQNVQIRIGAPRENVAENASPDNLKALHRGLGAYLSVRDQTQLVVKSVETENIEDENGVPFHVFYGISGNSHRFWSLTNARKIIGYEPEDDSQVRFADQIGTVITAAQEKESGKQ
ncbi:MAG: NAD(P)-dependent oxidoreductase [bacterium]|nr:NAD(P)-dependent oxidoreductase [bacterium]